MKKYLLILISLACLWSCGSEDETIDISILPPITSTGANTFGCLVDGWVYVGGRYRDWEYSDPWSLDSFIYYEKKYEDTDILNVSLSVMPAVDIEFCILNPQEGKECTITFAKFEGEELQDGTALITRFDTKKKIISGTFTIGNRVTRGRFDVHYALPK